MLNKRNLNHSLLLQAGFAPAPASGEHAMLENNGDKKGQEKKGADKEMAMMEAVERRFNEDRRGLAASMLVEWASDGEPTWQDFSALAISLADLPDLEDGDDDYTDEQVDAYNEALADLAYAAIALGADQDDVTSMIDDEDDDAAAAVYDAINDIEDTDDAIAQYTIAGDDDDAMFEAPKIKVVRDGKVKLIRKRIRKQRRTSKQKAALKKAQRKSHTSTAKLKQRKSMKLRKKRGM
ncbi:hypothetical protein CJP72_12205 [Citrobacter sp. NCU1]|uniref:hypothetical protein n=1 Tax=Citrobacter sp. NCU1 TaxID=2026683 RepID=UPI0013917A78|nr:hypothetical protein [Citrobacter sp. NCU1]NDO81500.1 hypothetical protein [Citrobacter sp. NCU1]